MSTSLSYSGANISYSRPTSVSNARVFWSVAASVALVAMVVALCWATSDLSGANAVWPEPILIGP